jgi:MFS family permease
VQSILASYLAFLRLPDVKRMVVVAFIGRLPIGMGGLAMLMFLRDTLGNFAISGSVVGAYFIAMAAAAPVLGRLIDRIGPRRPLIVTGIVQPLALLALFVATLNGAGYALVITFAIIAGLFAAPITVLTRTLWRHRFDQEDERRLAFAVDSVMIEFNFTLGPALVALLLATAGPATAFAVTIAATVIGFAAFIGSPALDYWRQEDNAERHLLGPLTEWRLLIVFAASFGLTFCFGLLEVGYPAFAVYVAMPALGGLLLSLNSIGSALGGAAYGGMKFRMPLERQFALALGLMSLPLFAHSLSLHPVVFALTAFVAGLAIAPTLTAQTILVSRIAPAKHATEAFTWSSLFIVSGIGAGMAVGGALSETLPLGQVFAIGAVVVLAMSLLALALPVRAVR